MAQTKSDHGVICLNHACHMLITISLLLMAWLLPAPVQAAPIDLHHAAWTAHDGAPTMVLTIAQTNDGWLWLGGPNGLFRFDGVRFERYADPDAPLPTTGISILSAQPSGDLWIGYRFGGASRLSQGSIHNYDDTDGLPKNFSVWGLEADAGGRMWAATAKGMFYLENTRWHSAGPGWGLGSTIYKTLMRDRRGVLWAQGDKGVDMLVPGARRFVKLPVDSGLGVVLEVRDGSVWSWDSHHNRLNRLALPPGGIAPGKWTLHGDVGALLFDRAGDLWVGRDSGVERHTAHGLTRTGAAQGLSADVVLALFEDREGNIWASTSNGIDRFRGKWVSKVSMPENPNPESLAADRDGGVWAGRYHVARPGAGPVIATPLWPASPVAGQNMVTSSYLDPTGVLWTGAANGLWRKKGATIKRVPLPNGLPGGQFNSIARDAAGNVWVSIFLHGLFRMSINGEWEKEDGRNGLPDEPPRVMAIAGNTGLWMGYPRSTLLHQEDGRWHSYGPGDGLRLGMVMALHLHGAHVWAGGENGLALRQGDKFIAVSGIDQAFENITGILELNNGDLWINGVSGLFRIPSAEIGKLATMPTYRVRYERLDALDGLEGTAPLFLPTPSLVAATDGQLWVTTIGVFRLDPEKRPPARAAPPVLIRKIRTSTNSHTALSGMKLEPGPGTVQIEYAAMALGMPERIRFRYRLDGVDERWQEAGRRHAAFYNNLAAGDYHFHVQASDDTGQWPSQESKLDFSIAPTFTQTWWFKGMCGLMLLAAAWTAYWLRLRTVIAQMASRLEERIDERERIARELHDTLLQSVQGLILNVDAAAAHLPASEPTRALIEAALVRAEDVLHEGRDRVRGLRNADNFRQGFIMALNEAAAQVQTPGTMPVRLVVDGKVRGLYPVVQQEALAIASEAFANAYRHAKASAIEAVVVYGAREFRLSIRDDGAGIAPEVLSTGGKDDHWGFLGMHERARRIKAKLTLRSGPGAGTEWTLALAGARAYMPGKRQGVAKPGECPG